MQSIYRFRNAEVGHFLMAKKAGVGSLPLEPLTLRRSFRSGQHLVDWFNAVFPNVLAATDNATQGAVAYSDAVSVPGLAGQGACIVHPVLGSDAATEAEHGCRVIRDTLAAHPDDDMAVLVRGRNHLHNLLSQLRNDGVPYRAVEIDRLTDLPEIIDILALTRALVHRGDRLAWLAILRSPWVGLDWRDLHALVDGRSNATVWELLHADQQLAQLSSFGCDAVRRLREKLATAMRANRVESLRDTVESTWLALGGPAILGDAQSVEHVYRFLDVIETLEEGGTLSDVAELEDALDLEHVSTDSTARLQIMTMHRAKGLQFDHVLLYGLGRAPGRQERTVLSWFDVPGPHGAARRSSARSDHEQRSRTIRCIGLSNVLKQQNFGTNFRVCSTLHVPERDVRYICSDMSKSLLMGASSSHPVPAVSLTCSGPRLLTILRTHSIRMRFNRGNPRSKVG